MSQPHFQSPYVYFLETVLSQLYHHHLTVHKDCVFRVQQPDYAVAAKPNTAKSLCGLDYHYRSTPGSQATPNSQAPAIKSWDFVPYDPTKVPEPRNRGSHQWKPVAQKLISSTPAGVDWWDKIQTLGLHHVMQDGAAAQFVLHASPLPSFGMREVAGTLDNRESEEGSLIHAAKLYAQRAASHELSTQCVLSLVNLQKLVLLGTCFVLSQIGVSRDPLVEITRICFGNISEEHAVRLWRVGLFVNELVDGLALRGWGNRASELLLICISPSLTLKEFLTSLSRESPANVIYSICLGTKCGAGIPHDQTLFRSLYHEYPAQTGMD